MNIHLLLFVFLFSPAGAAFSQVTALPNAHAHNDYRHAHPLQDAMACGFTSAEADVFFKRGKFIIAHLTPLLKKKGNLETLYLKPLADSIHNHPGYLYAGYPEPVILLIDIKTNAERTYAALKPLLEKYAAILTRFENGRVINGAVTVILSGNKPYASLKNERTRFAFIDEALLSVKKENANVCPLTSVKYSDMIIRWKGKGCLPAAEKNKLTAFVNAAHEAGKKVRLWASPDNKVVWQELLNCGVDLINTDDLPGLRDFLLER